MAAATTATRTSTLGPSSFPALNDGCSMGTAFCPLCGWTLPPSLRAGDSVTCGTCTARVTLPLAVPDEEWLTFDRALFAGLPTDPVQVAFGSAAAASSASVTALLYVEGHCTKCQTTTKCTVYSRQERGADEGQTDNYTCTVCGHKWRHNT